MKIKQILSHLNKERGCVICGFQNAAGDVQGNFQDVEQTWRGRVDIEKTKNNPVFYLFTQLCLCEGQ